MLEAGPTTRVSEHPISADGENYLVPAAKAKFYIISPDRLAKLLKAAADSR